MKRERSLLRFLAGKGRLDILELLRVASRPETINGLARRAALPVSTTWLAVHDLRGLGLVRVESLGRDSMVTLNHESPLVPRLEALLGLDLPMPHTMAFEDFARRVRARLPKVEVRLFGSAARGAASAQSDVDVMVIYGGTTYDRARVGTVSDRAALQTIDRYGIPVTAIVTERPLEFADDQ